MLACHTRQPASAELSPRLAGRCPRRRLRHPLAAAVPERGRTAAALYLVTVFPSPEQKTCIETAFLAPQHVLLPRVNCHLIDRWVMHRRRWDACDALTAGRCSMAVQQEGLQSLLPRP